MALQRLDRLPTEAAPPQHRAPCLLKLGTDDEDAVEMASKALFSVEELRVKADAAMQRRVEAGIQVHAPLLLPVHACTQTSLTLPPAPTVT